VKLHVEALEDRRVLSTLHVGAHETYHTIAAALTAAKAGDTIQLKAGVYQEAVNITKNDITLRGDKNAVIKAPNSVSDMAANGYSLVQVNGAQRVTLRDLNINGLYSGGFDTVGNNLLGIHAGIFISHGGSATIRNNHVTNVRDAVPNNTVDDGFAILVGSISTVLNTTGSAVLENNTIDGYQSCGVDVANTGSIATIRNNTVVGLGAALGNQYQEQVGISTEGGGSATVTNNTVSNNVQTTSNIAYAYWFNDTGSIAVTNNKASGNNYGIVLINVHGGLVANNDLKGDSHDGIVLFQSSGVVVLNNNVKDSGGSGISLFSSTGNTLLQNDVKDSSFDGIYVDSGSTGNLFFANKVKNSGHVDLDDLSTGSGTAGTGNTWVKNKAKTDNHGGGLGEK
jgi:parallel beta-helix repeat protein